MNRLIKPLLAISIWASTALILTSTALASGAITGSATAAGSGASISGLSVCAEENFLGGVHSGCTATDAAGHYTIANLPGGSNYQVEFSTPPVGTLNYLTQYWQAKEGLDNWDPVTVTDGSTTAGIDAVMNPGAEISGHLSEQGSGAPVSGLRVCVLNPAPGPRAEEFERCATSDAAGNYVVRALPAATYVVAFAHYPPLNLPEPFAEIYYSGATDKGTATPIPIAPPEVRTGIDATLVNRLHTTIRPMKSLRLFTPYRRARVGFRFFVPLAGEYSFVCRRDGGPWRYCRSPLRYVTSVGPHVLKVRAISPSGVRGSITSAHFRLRRRMPGSAGAR